MADNQYLTSSGQALHQPAQDVQVQTPEQVNYTEKIKNAMTNKMMALDNKITGAVVNKAGYDVYQHHKQIAQGYEEGKYFQGTGKFDVISNLVFKLTEATGMQEQAVALVAPFARDLIKATNNPMLKQLLGMVTGGLLRAESAKKTKDISKVISKIEAVFDGVGAAAKLAIQGLSAVGGYVKGVVTDIASNFVTNTDDFFATMLSGAGFMGPFLKMAFPYLKQLAGLMKDGILLAGKWLLKGAFSPFKYLGKSLMSWIFKPKNEQTKAIDTQMALVSGMKTLNTAVTLLANVMGGKGGKATAVLSKVKEGTEKVTEGHTLGKIEATPTASLTSFFTGGFLRSKYAKAEGVTEGTNVVSVDKYNFNQATEMQGSLGGGHLKVDYEKIKKAKQESKEQQEPHVEVQANKHIESVSSVVHKPEPELLEPEKEKRKKSETQVKTETKPSVTNTTTVTNVNNPITNVANTSVDKSIKTETHVKNNFISNFIESLKSKLNLSSNKQVAVTKATPKVTPEVVSATTRMNQPVVQSTKGSKESVIASKTQAVAKTKELESAKVIKPAQVVESKEIRTEKTVEKTKSKTAKTESVKESVANKRLTELSKKESKEQKTVEKTKTTKESKKETSFIKSTLSAPFKAIGVGFNKTTALISSKVKSIKATIVKPFKLISSGFSKVTASVSDKLKSLKTTLAKSIKSAVIRTKDILLSPFKLISTGFNKLKESATALFKSTATIIAKPFKAVGAFTKSAISKTASLFTKKESSEKVKEKSNAKESTKTKRSLIESVKGVVTSNKLTSIFKKSKENTKSNKQYSFSEATSLAGSLGGDNLKVKSAEKSNVELTNKSTGFISKLKEKSATVTNKLPNVKESFTTVISKSKEAIIDKARTAKELKLNIKDKFANSNITNTIATKLKTSKDFIKSNLLKSNKSAINSNVIVSESSKVTDQTKSLFTTIKTKFNDVVKSIKSFSLKDVVTKPFTIVATQFSKLKDSLKSKILKVKDLITSPFKLISTGFSKLKDKTKSIITTLAKPFTTVKSAVKSGFTKVSSLFSSTDKANKTKLEKSKVDFSKLKQQTLKSKELSAVKLAKTYSHNINKLTDSNDIYSHSLNEITGVKLLNINSSNSLYNIANKPTTFDNKLAFNTNGNKEIISESHKHYNIAKSKDLIASKSYVANNVKTNEKSVIDYDALASWDYMKGKPITKVVSKSHTAVDKLKVKESATTNKLNNIKFSSVAAHTLNNQKVEKIHSIKNVAVAKHTSNIKESSITNTIESAINSIKSELNSDKFIKFAKSIVVDSLKSSSKILKSAITETSKPVTSVISPLMRPNSLSAIAEMIEAVNSKKVETKSTIKESKHYSINANKTKGQLKSKLTKTKETISNKVKESSKESIASKIENANKSNSFVVKTLKSISSKFKTSLSKISSKLKLDKLNNVIKSSFSKIGSAFVSIGSKIKNSKIGKAITNTIAKWKEKITEGKIIGKAIGSVLGPIFKGTIKLVSAAVFKSIPFLVSNISTQFKAISERVTTLITKDLPESISRAISNSEFFDKFKSTNAELADKISESITKVITKVSSNSGRVVTTANATTHEFESNVVDLSEFSDVLNFEKEKTSTKEKSKSTKLKEIYAKKHNVERQGHVELSTHNSTISKSGGLFTVNTKEKSKEKTVDKSAKELTSAIKSINKAEKTKVSTNVAIAKLQHVSTKTLKDINVKDTQISKFTKQTVSGINRLANALTKKGGFFSWLGSLFSSSNKSKKDNSVSIFKKLANSIAKSFKSLKNIITSPFKSIARGFNNLKTTVAKTMNSIKTKIVDTVTKPFKIMKSAYTDLKKAISNKVTNTIKAAKDKYVVITSAIKDKYNKVVEKSKEFLLKAKQSSINLMKSAKDKFSSFATGFSSLFGGKKAQKIIRLTADKTISNSDNIVVKASNVEIKESKISKMFSNFRTKLKSFFSFNKSNESKESTESKSFVSKITDKFRSFKMPKLSNPFSGLFGKKYSFDIKQADITATTVNVGNKSFLGSILSGIGSLVTGTLLLPFKMIGALFGGGNRKLIKISTELNKKFDVALDKLTKLASTITTLSKHIINKDKVSIFDRIKSFAKLGLTKVKNSKIYQKSKLVASKVKQLFTGNRFEAINSNISKLVSNNSKVTDKLLQAVKEESKVKTSNVSKSKTEEKSSSVSSLFASMSSSVKSLATAVASKATAFRSLAKEKLSKFKSSKVGQFSGKAIQLIDKQSKKLASKFLNTKLGKFVESKFGATAKSKSNIRLTKSSVNSKASRYAKTLGVKASAKSNNSILFNPKLNETRKTNIELNSEIHSKSTKNTKYNSIIAPLISTFKSFALTIKELSKTVSNSIVKSATNISDRFKLSKESITNFKTETSSINSTTNNNSSKTNVSKGFTTTKLASNLSAVNNNVSKQSNLAKSAFVRVATIKHNESTKSNYTNNIASNRTGFFNNLAKGITSFTNLNKTNTATTNTMSANLKNKSETNNITPKQLTKSFTTAIESTQEKESFRQKVLERRKEQREIKREQRTNKLLEGILKNTKHSDKSKKSEDSFLKKLFNFGKKLLFGPLGKILGLLGAGFALFKNFSGSIVKSLFSVSKFIGAFAIKGIFKIIKTLTSSLKSVGKFLWKGALKIGSKLATVVGSALSGLKNIGSKIASAVSKVIGSVWNTTKNVASNTVKGAKKVAGKVWDVTKNVATKTWDGAKFLANKISTMFKGSAEFFKTKLGGVFTGAKEIVSKTLKSVINAGKSVWDTVKNTKVGKVVTETATKVWNGAKVLTTKVTEMFKGAGAFLKTKISNIFAGAKSLFSNSIISSFANGAKNVASGISNMFKGAAESVTSKVGKIFDGAKDIFKSGLKGIFKGLGGFLKGLFAGLFSGIFNLFKIKKPDWLKKLTEKPKPKVEKPTVKPKSNIKKPIKENISLKDHKVKPNEPVASSTNPIGATTKSKANIHKVEPKPKVNTNIKNAKVTTHTVTKNPLNVKTEKVPFNKTAVPESQIKLDTKVMDSKTGWFKKVEPTAIKPTVTTTDVKSNKLTFKPNINTKSSIFNSTKINTSRSTTSVFKPTTTVKPMKLDTNVMDASTGWFKKVEPTTIKNVTTNAKQTVTNNIKPEASGKVTSNIVKTTKLETTNAVESKFEKVSIKTTKPTANVKSNVFSTTKATVHKPNVVTAKTTANTFKPLKHNINLNTKIMDSKTGWFKKVDFIKPNVANTVKETKDATKITAVVKDKVKTVVDNVKAVVTKTKDKAVKVIDKSKQAIKTTVDTTKNAVKKIVDKAITPVKNVVKTATNNSKVAAKVVDKSVKVAKVASKGAKLVGGTALKIVGKVATPAFLMYDMYDKGFNTKDTFGVDVEHSTWNQRAAQMTGTVANSLSLGLIDAKDFAQNLDVTLNAFKGLYGDSREDHIKKAPKIKLPYYLKVYDYDADTKTFILKDTKNGIMVYRRGNVYQIGKKYYSVAQGEAILEAIGKDKKLDPKKAQDIYSHMLVPSVTSVLGASKYGYAYVAQYKNVKIPYGYSLKDKKYRIYGKTFDSIQSARKFLIQTMRYQLGIKPKVTQKEATKNPSINTVVQNNKNAQTNTATVTSVKASPTQDKAFIKSMTAEQLADFNSKSEKEQLDIYTKWKSEHKTDVNAVVVPLVNQSNKNTKVATAKFNQIVKEASHNKDFLKSLAAKHIQFDKLNDQDKVKLYKTWYKNKLQQKHQATATKTNSSWWFAPVVAKAKQLVTGVKEVATKAKQSAKDVYAKVTKIPLVKKSFNFVKTMAKAATSTIVIPLAASANTYMHKPDVNTNISKPNYYQSNDYDRTIEPEPAKLVIKKYKTPKGHIQLDLKAPFNVKDLRQDLVKHEGEVLHVYKDSLGYLTIGTGHLLPPKGIALRNIIGFDTDQITKEQNQTILNYDIARTATGLYSKLPWLAQQPDDIQIALNDMAFNVGVNGLLNFKKTLSYIKTGNYEAASKEVLRSKWAKQVGSRSKDISARIEKVGKSIPKKNIKTHIEVGPDVESNTNVELNENTETNVNSFKGANSIWDILHPQKSMTSEETTNETSSLFEWPTFNFGGSSLFESISPLAGFSSESPLFNNTESTLGTNLSINPNSNTLLDFNTSSVIETTHKDLKQIIKSKAAQVAETKNSQTKETSTETRNPQNPIVYNVFQKMEVNNTNSTIANSTNSVTNVHGQGTPGASYRTDYQ